MPPSHRLELDTTVRVSNAAVTAKGLVSAG